MENTIQKDLVGKKINKIYMDLDYLRFDTDDGSYTYEVLGDCCSCSYFYDFYGVKNLLNNSKVTEVKEVELSLDDKRAKGYKEVDVDQFYGYQITTVGEFGEVTSVFSFRNVSNGYYGGWMCNSDFKGDIQEVTDDVTGLI